MKEINSVSDDPEFKEASAALERCQTELLKVADRSSAIEIEILSIKETPADDDQWHRFKAGGSIDSGARSRMTVCEPNNRIFRRDKVS